MILSSVIKRRNNSQVQGPADAQRNKMPRHPIVLCHGLLGFDTLFGGLVNYWKDIPQALKDAGAVVYVAHVPATSAVETRAAILKDAINREFPGQSVHLIGHSMGGLDCRFLVTHLMAGARFKVLSVSTIATPHQGSAVADLVISTKIDQLKGFSALLNMLPMGDGDGQAFGSLSTLSMRTFNATTPDVPGVRYLSWGASFVPGVMDQLVWAASCAALFLGGANDGMVPVTSAKWGEYLGTVQHVNHTEIIGHKFTQTRPTDILNFIGGQPFDHQKFFLDHAHRLAYDVEASQAKY